MSRPKAGVEEPILQPAAHPPHRSVVGAGRRELMPFVRIGHDELNAADGRPGSACVASSSRWQARWARIICAAPRGVRLSN
jgi:hypothetical protein